MNQSELKEAINWHKKQILLDGVGMSQSRIHLETLLDLAQQYLDIKGFPTKAYDPTLHCQPEFASEYEQGKVVGFNEALHLCKLAQMKKLEGIDELIADVLSGISEDECQSTNGWWETSTGATFGHKKKLELQDKIRQHMGGK